MKVKAPFAIEFTKRSGARQTVFVLACRIVKIGYQLETWRDWCEQVLSWGPGGVR